MSHGNSALGNNELGSTATASRPLFGTQTIDSSYSSETSRLLLFLNQEISATYNVEGSNLLNLNIATDVASASYNIETAELKTGTFLTDIITYSENVEDGALSGTTTIQTDSIAATYEIQNNDLSGTTLATTEIIQSNYSVSDSKLTIILSNEGIDYGYTVQTKKLLNIATENIQSSYAVESAQLQDLNLDNTSINAVYDVASVGTDVIGDARNITVLINGSEIETFTNIEAKKRLNEVDTFSFQAFIEDSSDRALIQEGNEVKIIEGYNDLLFKGVLNEVEYKSNFRAECEGNGMVQTLLDRKTNRDTYDNTAGDDIVKSEVPTSIMQYGTIDAAPQVSVSFDHDNLARAVAGVANATGFDWYIDQQASDDFDTDYLNFVDQAGDGTVQETFEIGGNAQMVERNKDDGFVANDITLLGRGDGINQLEARVFAATTQYTDTSQIITENESTSFTVDDTTQLGTTGDNLKVRVGTEVMDVDITDGTTLSINSRGLNDYEGESTEQIKHYENIRVWLVENVTQGVGPFTPEDKESAEDGSSIATKGVKEQRDTDKTIVDISTLEKTADLELKNRFEDIFRVQIEPVDPRTTKDLSLGDTVVAEDLTAMDVSDEFRIVGMDVKRASSSESTVLHLANRPRRLTERLSEIESNTDTLNAHMQGATNFNGEHFEDNCDNTHPLTNKVFIPDDVVEINKFELTFARESFRGYTENTEAESSHTHEIDESKFEHIHSIDVSSDPSAVDTEYDQSGNTGLVTTGGTLSTSVGLGFVNNDTDYSIITVTVSVENSSSSVNGWNLGIDNDSTSTNYFQESDFIPGDALSPVRTVSIVVDGDIEGDDISATISNQSDQDENASISLSVAQLEEHQHNIDDTSEPAQGGVFPTSEAGSAHSHGVNYGIFEPGSEPDIDVEVRVDGNLVTTLNNVSVGDEITTPIDLKNDLSEPLTGDYHDIELTPVDTGGGENGRSRLAADVTEKVFIESTL